MIRHGTLAILVSLATSAIGAAAPANVVIPLDGRDWLLGAGPTQRRCGREMVGDASSHGQEHPGSLDDPGCLPRLLGLRMVLA